MANLVDWALAEQIGLRFMPKGPTTTPSEAHGVVAELRELAQLAREPVRALTGLDADPEHAPAVVVDRGEWIQSNIAGLGVALDPFVSSRADKPANPGIEAVGSRLTAAQLGGAMAWLSGKVLGQYEAFSAPGKPGRLLLVARTSCSSSVSSNSCSATSATGSACTRRLTGRSSVGSRGCRTTS